VIPDRVYKLGNKMEPDKDKGEKKLRAEGMMKGRGVEGCVLVTDVNEKS